MLHNEINELIQKRKMINDNNAFDVDIACQNLVRLLTRNKNETLSYLFFASEEEIFWISEVFEEVAAVFQSQDYIDCLRFLEKKYPNLKLKSFVDDAYNWSNLE